MTTTESGPAGARRALLEQRIAQAAQRAAAAAGPVPQIPAPAQAEPAPAGVKEVPFAVAQRPLWWFDQLTPDTPLYNEIVHLTKTGPLDVPALGLALNDLIARHEAWRTSFEIRDGEPVQIVHPSAAVDIPLIDLGDLDRAAATAAAVDQAAGLARKRYDLTAAPLLRPLLVRFGPQEHRLYLALHHLIFDGVTLVRIVLPELAALYEARVTGRPPGLPPAPQYADFVEWERSDLASTRMTANIDFHRQRLAELSTLDLPLDKPRPTRPRYAGAVEQLQVPGAVVERLREIGAESSATLFQVLAAAYSVLLSRFSGQDDIVFGTPIDLRRRRDLVSVVGMCVSTAVLRVRLAGDPRFCEVLEELRDQLADVLDRHVPFDVLVRELQPERDQRLHPLFQAGFVLEPPLEETDPAWSLAQIEVELGDALAVAKFDLHLELDEQREGHLAGRLIVNTDLFERASAQRLVRAFLVLLEGIAADPKRPVSELPVLAEAEQSELVAGQSAGPSRPASATSLTAALEQTGADFAARPAVSFEGRTLPYRQLHEAANALAERLVRVGAGPGTIVGVGCERSLEMTVGLLAVLKAGAAYLPLDPALPIARLHHMVADTRAPILLVDGSLSGSVDQLADHDVTVVKLAGCLAAAAPQPPAAAAVAPADPAYVIYTSGSTGTPKGVVVPHGAIVNTLDAYRDGLGFHAGSRFLALATMSFDIAAAEIWLPLTSGECVVLASRADGLDPGRLAALIRDEKVSIVQAVPTVLQSLVDTGWSGADDLTIFSGGEHLSASLAESLNARCARLWNLYGPTEATVFCTVAAVADGEPITIGRPIRNTRVYVLDPSGRPVPTGVAGELYVGGAGVTSGYLNRPELTAERFVADLRVPAERMYRTGDLARHLPDGRIELLGRMDQQVKIRGNRVELGEIESVLATHPGVATAAVVVRDSERLVAYVVPAAGATPRSAELRGLLAGLLPAHMVPATFVTLDSMPVTAGGKIDRLALPEPTEDHLVRGSESRPDLTESEQRLARVWANVLGLESVGAEEDFFALGGHSLLAVRLVTAIESEFAIDMPLVVLMDGDVTVRAVASRLGLAPDAPSASTASVTSVKARPPQVVRFHDGGDRPPLLLFFPSAESLFALRHLQAMFDQQQPVIGLLAGLDDMARYPKTSTVPQIAREALATVRQLQPAGQPYRIAGYSVAGLVAYELAGMLAQEGADVDWLGLIDTYSPSQVTRELSVGLYLRRSLARNWRDSVRSAAARVRTESTVVSADLAARLRKRPLDRFDELGVRHLMRGYTPSGHPLPLNLFVTQDSSERAVPMLGWSQLHPGPVQIHRVDGDHMSIMRGDAARRLGAALVAALRTIGSEVPAAQ